MSTTTISIALPEAIRAWIDQRVTSGKYGNTSEYLRDLIRLDQEEQARQLLHALIEDGVTSGPPRELSPDGPLCARRH